jgi:hypothetical protein
MTGGTVSVIRSGILDAKGRRAELVSARMCVWPPMWCSVRISASVSTPQLITVPHTYEALTGPVQVPDGFAHHRTNRPKSRQTVTEQNGVQQDAEIGTEYHSSDVMLLQDGFYRFDRRRNSSVQNVEATRTKRCHGRPDRRNGPTAP